MFHGSFTRMEKAAGVKGDGFPAKLSGDGTKTPRTCCWLLVLWSLAWIRSRPIQPLPSTPKPGSSGEPRVPGTVSNSLRQDLTASESSSRAGVLKHCPSRICPIKRSQDACTRRLVFSRLWEKHDATLPVCFSSRKLKTTPQKWPEVFYRGITVLAPVLFNQVL